MIDRAAGFLNPQQLNALRQMQENRLESMLDAWEQEAAWEKR